MKHLVSRFGLALIFLCCAPVIRAQFADVTSGSLSFTLADPLSTLLEDRNIVAKVFTPAPYGNQIPYLGVNTGVFNMGTGNGALSANGNFDIVNGVSKVSITALAFLGDKRGPQPHE